MPSSALDAHTPLTAGFVQHLCSCARHLAVPVMPQRFRFDLSHKLYRNSEKQFQRFCGEPDRSLIKCVAVSVRGACFCCLFAKNLRTLQSRDRRFYICHGEMITAVFVSRSNAKAVRPGPPRHTGRMDTRCVSAPTRQYGNSRNLLCFFRLKRGASHISRMNAAPSGKIVFQGEGMDVSPKRNRRGIYLTEQKMHNKLRHMTHSKQGKYLLRRCRNTSQTVQVKTRQHTQKTRPNCSIELRNAAYGDHHRTSFSWKRHVRPRKPAGSKVQN